MEKEMDNKENGILYSKPVRAGKRTYFFDVRMSKNGEKYLVIAESKKHTDPLSGDVQYEKHKLFLYNEVFEDFIDAFNSTINFIKTGIEEKNTKTSEICSLQIEEEAKN